MTTTTTASALGPHAPTRVSIAEQVTGVNATLAEQVTGVLGLLTAPSDSARAAQLVVDAARVVRRVDVHPDHTSRTQPEDVVAALHLLEG